VGLAAAEINRDGAFCDVVVTSREPLIVTDATCDTRFRDSVLVSGPLGVGRRFL
jgi:hypothetical protein